MEPLTIRPMMIALTTLAGALALLTIAAAASAHEHAQVGDLEFVVGWATEPAVTYQMNTVTISVERHLVPAGTEPVVGVEGNLSVAISTGPIRGVKSVEPQPGDPGTYMFAIVPTRVGTYTVHIEGLINGTAFNVSIDAENVVSGLDVNFPVTDPTLKELGENASAQQAQIDALQAQVTALQSGGGSPVTTAQLEEATATASTATLVAVVALLMGAAGAMVGAIAVWKSRRPPAAK